MYESLLHELNAAQTTEIEDLDLFDDDLTKSLTATIDGEEVEYFDGAEMIKSLEARFDEFQEQSHEVMSELVKSVLAGRTKEAEQDQIIKSLTATIEVLSGKGSGTKSVTAFAKSIAPFSHAPMTSEQLMLKSERFGDQLSYDETLSLTMNDYDPSRINAGLLKKIQSL